MGDDHLAPEASIWRGLRPYLYFILRLANAIVTAVTLGAGSTPFIDGYIKKWFGPPPAPLAVRAQEVSDSLIRTGELIDELQAEVKARMTLIEGLASQARDAEQRAADALSRANLSEEQAKAVDAFLDRAVKLQIDESEGRSRRREWGLATFGGLVIGVAAIAIAHFLLGF
jgi:hypothetical protein